MKTSSNTTTPEPGFPLILAPAGSRESFLAALAAEAEAVYCGLKNLSARMEAQNFTLAELVGLTELAHARGVKVLVTLNTLIKPGELDLAGRLIDELNRWVHPDALIFQDPAVVALARDIGFQGELHLSTLANAGFGAALSLIAHLPRVTRVVLPRELNVDELRQIAGACPEGLGLEVFVHGALCYGVSGRCYWSSFLGGKSGLRGRCVQPCRRLYRQGGLARRFFSCLDLCLDVLVKVLLSLPAVKGWKIEGRKKGPHYVYYTVKAYKTLRDHPQDPSAKKEALTLLGKSLGRPGTHYGFLTHRPSHPIPAQGHTASGLRLGTLSRGKVRPFLTLKQDLQPGDLLRIGYEDESWHHLEKVTRVFRAGGRWYPSTFPEKIGNPGPPVFLIDRRDPVLAQRLEELEKQGSRISEKSLRLSILKIQPPRPYSPAGWRITEVKVFRSLIPGPLPKEVGFWLSAETVRRTGNDRTVWWWLPPMLWPGQGGHRNGR